MRYPSLAASSVIAIGCTIGATGCLTPQQREVAASYALPVTANTNSTCIKQPSGTAFCYGAAVGDGKSGEFAHQDGYAPDGPLPGSVVHGLGAVYSIGGGPAASAFCAILASDHSVACWGWQTIDSSSHGVPKQVLMVPGLTGAKAVAVGQIGIGDLGFGKQYGACAVTSDDAVVCWQFGESTISAPTAVSGLSGITSVTVGAGHACAIGTAGALWCWGQNDQGQLGTGSLTSSPTPALVAGFSAQSVSAGLLHTCAVGTDGSVSCWGACFDGALGLPDTAGPGCFVSSPHRVLDAGSARGIAVGWGFSCALMNSDAVRCWGDNKKGQLGLGSSMPMSPTPAEVPGLGQVIFLAAGNTHACAAGRVTSVKCWGTNNYGQLTDGSTTPSSSPVPP